MTTPTEAEVQALAVVYNAAIKAIDDAEDAVAEARFAFSQSGAAYDAAAAALKESKS